MNNQGPNRSKMPNVSLRRRSEKGLEARVSWSICRDSDGSRVLPLNLKHLKDEDTFSPLTPLHPLVKCFLRFLLASTLSLPHTLQELIVITSYLVEENPGRGKLRPEWCLFLSWEGIFR